MWGAEHVSVTLKYVSRMLDVLCVYRADTENVNGD